jgi:hypothetical protein
MPSRLLVAVGAAAENPEQIPDGVRLLLDLEEIGHGAEGKVGADDPLLAFADAVDKYPDHILIGLRGSAEADWQEQGLVEKIFERFRLPITVFAI